MSRAPTMAERAAALGLKPQTLYHREWRARRRAEAGDAASKSSPWIGVRIHPPLEPDHPLAAAARQRADQIIARRHAAEAEAHGWIAGDNR